jgi:hypothetical protein
MQVNPNLEKFTATMPYVCELFGLKTFAMEHKELTAREKTISYYNFYLPFEHNINFSLFTYN